MLCKRPVKASFNALQAVNEIPQEINEEQNNINFCALITGDMSEEENSECVRTSSVANVLSGRRIVDIAYLFTQIQNEKHHGGTDCSLVDIDFVIEKVDGFHCTWVFQCKVCDIVSEIMSENRENKDTYTPINETAVHSTLATRGRYSQQSEFSAGVDMHCICNKTFLKHMKKVSEAIDDAALQSMLDAAEEEKAIAIRDGNVDSDGVPMCTVVVDGARCKRCYKTNYHSLSGVTNFVVMLTGDGDSFVHRKLLESMPYGPYLMVEKVECKNHVLLNYCHKLTDVTKNTKFPVTSRNLLKQQTPRFRTATEEDTDQLQKMTVLQSSCHLWNTERRKLLTASNFGRVYAIMDLKCPLSADKYGSPKEAVDNGQMSYCAIVNGKPLLRRDSNYYYQVQEQLHITGRKYCYFVVYTSRWMTYEVIEKDDEFWSDRMEQYLCRFCKECLLEDVVNPQLSKRFVKADIKDPVYITTAQRKTNSATRKRPDT
ncbi:hypothetical protein PR048_014053 [Dryococelus australis]|uniref:Mutator-like transposase domain-containing protein n=1 Tax=Dryococelus australis TaxID=614101 RepID=A0ABQ9HTW4_9NEOP|nr:hypothetical protein PR048_014053 [Dryococelus australis]